MFIISSKIIRNEIQNKKILEENASLEKELSDIFQGIEALKSFAKEEKGKSRAEKSLSQNQEVEVKRNSEMSKYRNQVDFIVHLRHVLLLYFGIREVISGQMTIGSYISLFWIFDISLFTNSKFELFINLS